MDRAAPPPFVPDLAIAKAVRYRSSSLPLLAEGYSPHYSITDAAFATSPSRPWPMIRCASLAAGIRTWRSSRICCLRGFRTGMPQDGGLEGKNKKVKQPTLLLPLEPMGGRRYKLV